MALSWYEITICGVPLPTPAAVYGPRGRDYRRSVDKVLAKVLKQTEPALSQPTSRTARDQLQAKRKQSALAQLSGKWEKR